MSDKLCQKKGIWDIFTPFPDLNKSWIDQNPDSWLEQEVAHNGPILSTWFNFNPSLDM